jgi:hypothetical protein
VNFNVTYGIGLKIFTAIPRAQKCCEMHIDFRRKDTMVAYEGILHLVENKQQMFYMQRNNIICLSFFLTGSKDG